MRLSLGASLVSLGLLLGGCRSAQTPPPEPPPAPESAPVPESRPDVAVPMTVVSRVLNLRQEASAKSAPLGRLKKGDKVSLIEERGGWARVRLADGTVGWVDARYVRRGDPCPADRQPVLLTEPVFRMSAEGPHGRVVVEGEVDIEGKVGETRVISSSSQSTEVAATAESELRKMRFLPPVKDCRPRPFTYTYTRSY